MASFCEAGDVVPGCERLFEKNYISLVKGKKIGLITNQTAIDRRFVTTLQRLKENALSSGYTITALFAPEHGIRGEILGENLVPDTIDPDGIPILSLHGKTFRPTKAMLENVDVLIYDIQDIGSRSYTFATTLFYVMEEAAQAKIPLIVLDRPNPINGMTVDGPVLKETYRSIVGYINTPYCHGMTIGELALYFNNEYKVGCKLQVVPMSGWDRTMTFVETGLAWIPTSPHIPEPTTPLYYPMTGILGELQIISIGVGYTLPFKIVGAPWLDADLLAKSLNTQNFPGVYFIPWHYIPQYGRYKGETCHGVLIRVTNHRNFLPVSTQYLILGVVKSLYPEKFMALLEEAGNRYDMFNKVNGTDEVLAILKNSKHIVWPLRGLHAKEREEFMSRRSKYLIY